MAETQTPVPRQLDRTRPFGQIYPPHEGAHFEQDGVQFTAQGVELLDPEADLIISETAARGGFERDELDAMHTNSIKKLMRDGGGEWTGDREAAIAWLLSEAA